MNVTRMVMMDHGNVIMSHFQESRRGSNLPDTLPTLPMTDHSGFAPRGTAAAASI